MAEASKTKQAKAAKKPPHRKPEPRQLPNRPHVRRRRKQLVDELVAAAQGHQIWDITLFQLNIDSQLVAVTEVDPAKELKVRGKAIPNPVGEYDISIYLSCQYGYFETLYATSISQNGFHWEVTFGTEYDLLTWGPEFVLEALRFSPRQTMAQIEFDLIPEA